MYNPRFGSTNVSISTTRAEASTLFLAKVFNWMAIGLGVTGLAAVVTANSPAMLELVVGNRWLMYGLLFGELGLVFYLSARIEQLSAAAATGLFLLYAALNGVTLSTLMLVFTMTSIASTFFITAGMFGAMAIYGLVTKKDLSGMGSFMMMGLVGMVIASLVNLFLGSSMVSWVVSAIGVVVFTGLTAYDVQQITVMGQAGIMNNGEIAIRRGAIMGALRLYLDFINLFLSLLQLLGDRK